MPAHINQGTRNLAPAEQIPTSYVRPTVAVMPDSEVQYTRRLTLSVAKATVETATPATTVAAIIANGTIGVTKQVLDLVAADYLAVKQVTFYTDVVSIKDGNDVPDSGNMYKNAAAAYTVIVDVKIKAV
jgi:hypothetical protein